MTTTDTGGPLAPHAAVDLLVIGAGAGGMTAALVAALEGLEVLLCEVTETVGGTTATSAGTVWLPGNRQGAAAGFADSLGSAATYLDAILGERDDRGLRAAFLKGGSEALDYLERRSAVRFVCSGEHPDYLEAPGALKGGRALSPLEFDGRLLGRDFDRIRPPIPEFMVLGGMMVSKRDIGTLVARYDSVGNLWRAARLVARYGLDRLRYRRGTRLVMGNALVARLYFSLRRCGVQIRFGTRLEALDVDLEADGARVRGARLHSQGKTYLVHARRGVVLATGGIGHSPVLRAQFAPPGVTAHCLAVPENRGEGILAATRVGAKVEAFATSLLWQPVSLVRRPDGETGLFPHLFLDRAKPGVIAVDRGGRRFVNEGVSYHHFVEGMLRAHARGSSASVHLICDAAFVRTYGLGVVPPRCRDLGVYIENRYLSSATSVAQLAERIGVDAAGLEESIDENNRFARAGKDEAFGKGEDAVSRFNGDPGHQPNPCLGAIAEPPFFAVEIWPADAASSTGLSTDANGAVLDAQGNAISGLYACGNDMASPFGGSYPGPGATLGPALLFGYRAARHAARLSEEAALACTDAAAQPAH